MANLRPWHALVAVNLVVLGALISTTVQSRTQEPVQDVVRARVVELVNERGEMRAQLHVAEDGGGELRLRGGSGDIRVKFGAGDDGAILLMMDGSADPVIRLASKGEAPSLRLGSPGAGERVIVP